MATIGKHCKVARLTLNQRVKGSSPLSPSIMSDKKVPAAARIAAAQAILDRGYGKPSQHMNIEEQRPMAILSEEPLSEEEWQRQYCS